MGVVEKIRECIKSGELGDIYYYDSTRVNLGLFQHDVNVIYDLAVHDLSIMDYLLGDLNPNGVRAIGKCHVTGQPENIAYINLFYDRNFIAHINVNWLSPVKIRKTMIGGSKKMIVFDDLEAIEKLKIYDSGVTVRENAEEIYQSMVGYRIGNIVSPTFDGTEALKKLTLHFIDCIEKKKKPITDGNMGLRIVRILQAASQSMQNNGQFVRVE
jgi:predicted dehydrogenase